MAMNKTAIGWTTYTWNPVSGCEKVSEGCKFCYAEVWATTPWRRLAFPNGFGLTLRPHKLPEPFRLKAPSLVFVNSMSDLFWEAIPDDYRARIFTVIERTPEHTYRAQVAVCDDVNGARLAYTCHECGVKRRNAWTASQRRARDQLEVLLHHAGLLLATCRW